MKKFSALLLLCMLTVLTARAEDFFVDNKAGRFLKRVDDILEHMQRSGIDTTYQEVPKLNRQVYIGAYGYWQDYRMHFPFRLPSDLMDQVPELNPNMFYETKAHSFYAELDLGIDWKGLLIEIPIPVRSPYIRSYGLASNGSKWGFRIRYKRARKLTGTRNYGTDAKVQDEYIAENRETLEEAGYDVNELENELANLNRRAVRRDNHQLKTFFIEGYYVPNSRKFSLSAGLFSDMVQKRSAGSVLFYGNYYWSKYSVNDMFVSDYDSFRTSQLSLGCGYGYNLALSGGKLLFHASVVPMISVLSSLEHKSKWAMPSSDMSDEEIKVLDTLKDKWSRFYDSAHDANRRFRANAFARFAANYSFDRYVVTFLLNYRNYGYSNEKKLGIMNQEVDAQLNLGFRF